MKPTFAPLILATSVLTGSCTAPEPAPSTAPSTVQLYADQFQDDGEKDQLSDISRLVRRVHVEPPTDETLPAENPIAQLLEALPASVYLVDSSGSMEYQLQGTGKSRLDAIKEFTFPGGAQVYVFSGKIWEGQPLSTLRADGGTPLWDSTYFVVHKSPSSYVTVFTDGEDTASRNFTPDDIIALARRTNTIVSVGAYGVPCDGDLERIAVETGGRCKSTSN